MHFAKLADLYGTLRSVHLTFTNLHYLSFYMRICCDTPTVLVSSCCFLAAVPLLSSRRFLAIVMLSHCYILAILLLSYVFMCCFLAIVMLSHYYILAISCYRRLHVFDECCPVVLAFISPSRGFHE
jgi:hypothetical protein